MSVNDTRANPLQQNQPTGTPAVAPAPGFIIHCRDCRHWNRIFPKANFAQCLKANNYSSSALLTTDLQTCSQAEAKAPR